ncbi:hypothetical protein [Aeromonas phage 59.1]|nr:hypothetical protein [Aeromonas phage 59.1]
MPAVNFNSIDLITRQREIAIARKRLRRYGAAVENEVFEFPCAGGCCKRVRVKLKNLRAGNVLVCNDRDTRDQCHRNLPSAVGGMTAIKYEQSAGHFMGVCYEDRGTLSALKATGGDAIRSVMFPIMAAMGIVKAR